MAPDTRPLFPTYLLPSFTFPFRRSERQQSTSSQTSVPSLSSSPISSANTSPSSSPPSAQFVLPSTSSEKGKGISEEAFHGHSLPTPTNKILESDTRAPNLYRAHPNTLKCVTCSTDIAFSSQIVSKGFTGRHGRAYLVAPPPRSASDDLRTKKSKSSNGREGKDKGELVNIKVGRQVNRELLTGMHVVADVSCTICGMVLGWKYVDAKEVSQKYKIGKFILEMKRVVLVVGWEDGDGGDEEVDESYRMEEVGSGDEPVVFDSEDEDECEDLFAGVWDMETVARRRGGRVTLRN
jgi:hypothetical protein